ncbi:MAG: signal peptidase II [Actinobacteria bacterium]|nr:signal peptidase II [Actinomycetota bacterium]
MDDAMPPDATVDVGVTEPANGTPAPGRRWRARIAPLSLMVAAVIVVLDQITKHWAVNELSGDREIHVIWTLQWNLSFNTGMAFSQGQGLGPVIALLAMLIVIVLVVSSAHVESRLGRFAAGMLIGGAIGNLIDRLFRGDGWLHGAVVDFIDFQWFPIFNIADIGVTVGASLFALATILDGRRRDIAAASEPNTDASNTDASNTDASNTQVDS